MSNIIIQSKLILNEKNVFLIDGRTSELISIYKL